MASRGGSDSAGGAESHDSPLHVLSEDKCGEVVLERLPGEVELPLFQALEEVSKTRAAAMVAMADMVTMAPTSTG